MRILKLISLVSLICYVTLAQAELKVGMVFDRGGKDDKSFNTSAFTGATNAKANHGISYKYVEAADDMAFEPTLRSFAQKNYDLIIGIGFAQAEPLTKIAKMFPDRKFAIVDAKVGLPNVRSLLFEEHEGSFLVGAMAAAKVLENSKSGKVGFIGGMDIPLIRRFEMGYSAGAKHFAKSEGKKIETIAAYIGSTSAAWNDPAKAKEIALSQYQGGANVIFSACGASGNGIFDAAEEKKKFAIGVDSNQNWIKPGLILTSMLKRVDRAVEMTIDDAVKEASAPAQKFGGVKVFGLSNQGIDYAMDQHNKSLVPASVLAKIEALKADILKGKIKVPDYYKVKK